MFRSSSPLTLDLRHRQNHARPSSSSSPVTTTPPKMQPVRPSPTYHDVRLHSTHKNVILIKGSPHESDPVSISGHVVFSLLEKTCVSSVTLNLLGTYNIHFVENFQASNGRIIATCPFEDRQNVLCCRWDNLLTSPEGRIEDASKSSPPAKASAAAASAAILPFRHSHSPLQHNFNNYKTLRYSTDIPLGTTPFANVDCDNTLYELPPGNYSFPFHITLPGTIPETVESMKSVSIVYRLESTINTIDPYSETGVATSSFSAFKYVRVVRTLSSLQLALNEEFLAENSWARKLQYKIRTPRKLIPVGSILKIYLLIIPTMKKLKLGKITIQIVQYLRFNSTKPNDFGEKTFTDEKVVYQKSLPVVPQSQLPQDVWALEAHLPTSDVLKHCSPDVDTASRIISVRHKLIIFINLVNPDGHISQIKSKIPLGFYIKPGTKLYGKNVDIDKHTGIVTFASGKSLVFDASSINTPPAVTSPELIVCQCDELNPDSFLFQDTSNAEETDVSYPDPSPPSPAILIPQLSENPKNCTTNCDVPPSYSESANDIVFEPNFWSEGTSPIMGTPRLGTPSLGELSHSNSMTRLVRIDEDVPSYRKVYDDDVSNIGEPAPLYTESPARSTGSFIPRVASSPSSLLRTSFEKRHMNTTLSSSVPVSRPVSPLISVSSSSLNRQGNDGYSLQRGHSSALLHSNTIRNGDSPQEGPETAATTAPDVDAAGSIRVHRDAREQIERSGLTSCFSSSSDLDMIGV